MQATEPGPLFAKEPAGTSGARVWSGPRWSRLIDGLRASMFVAVSPDESALREVAALIRTAHEDETVLRQALKNANPKLMD